MNEPLVIDIETTATDPWRGVMLCVGYANAYESGCWEAGNLSKPLLEALASPDTPIISHSTFDPRFLKMAKYTITGPYYDTRYMAHLLDENTPLTLEWLAKEYLGLVMDKRLQRRDKKMWFRLDDGRTEPLEWAFHNYPEQVMAYCRRDADATFALYTELRIRMDKSLWTQYWLKEEVPYTERLVNMECAGLPINLKKAEVLRDKLAEELQVRESELLRTVGYDINLGSGDQLAEVLFKSRWWQEESIKLPDPEAVKKAAYNAYLKMGGRKDTPFAAWKLQVGQALAPKGFKVQKVGREILHGHYLRKGFDWKETPPTPGGKRPSTSTPDLMVHHVDKPFVVDLVQYRKVDKIISTYLDTYPEHTKAGRLYGRFNQAGTVTGRLSSSEPNLMNQPRRGELGRSIRSLFEGDLIVGDHSQLEARLAAHFSQDPLLLNIYRDNLDIYVETAGRIFGGDIKKGDPKRDLCKTLWLGSQYGAFPPKLASTMCLNGFPTTEKEAEDLLMELRRVYSTMFRWRDHVILEARESGYVKTLGGRYRRLRGAFHKGAPWKLQSRGERQAVNAIIQGSAADILRRNMLHTTDEPVTLLAQVHDELVWELTVGGVIPEQVLPSLKSICENPGYSLHVPLVFEPIRCDSWAEKDGPLPGKDVEVAA